MKFPKNINNVPVKDRPVRFSVASNFDKKLIENISDYPVYEVYGKLTTDFFGGGRPSFYLPDVDKTRLANYVKYCHENGIEFNYLLNSSSMNNVEFTTKGQRELRKLLDWLSSIEVDSITVSNLFFLRAIKKNYPEFKVRISAHRETDNARQVRFWEDNGADCVVISETTIHREFKILRAMREAVDIDLSLIVNNWCRQDCAIASNHAVLLSNASRRGKQNFPLDYCSVYCNAFRLEEPVNYLRANWIRPEDLHYYEEMGYTNFKIVERNTPTDILTLRVDAYHNRKYDGNLLDIVQNYAYPASSMKSKDEKDSYSLKRKMKYFFKPFQFNMTKFTEIDEYGKNTSMLYPRKEDNPVFVDNRALDGFLKRFEKQGCEELDCENCFYCHKWAEKTVYFNKEWREKMTEQYDHLLEDLHNGELWEPYYKTLKNRLFSGGKNKKGKSQRDMGGEVLPKMKNRKYKGASVAPKEKPCTKEMPEGILSVGNEGLTPEEKIQSKKNQN
ncbi:MAG: U32 family peptidase [Crocinitomicaceae bacterium]|nr:U32 family peptidase [Crocinitomicaceae bacterium]